MPAYRKIILLLAALAVLLCGCTPSSVSDKPSGEGAKSETPKENICITGLMMSGGVPSPDGRGLYKANGSIIRYRDFSSDANVVMCAQQGCKHEDSTCVAWQGSVRFFGVYRDMWYTLTQEEDTSMKLIRTDPKDNTRQTLYSWDLPEDGGEYFAEGLNFSYGRVYIPVRFIPKQEEGTLIQERYEEMVQIDLSSGEAEVFEFPEATYITFMGAAPEKVYIEAEYLDMSNEPLLSEDEFYAKNDAKDEEYPGDAYIAYHDKYSYRNTFREIRAYSEPDKYSVAASDNVTIQREYRMCYGNRFIYVSLDKSNGDSALHVYDMDAQTDRVIVEDKWIINCQPIDGNVNYITHVKGSDIAKFYYIGMDGGERHVIENEGNTAYMAFALYYEAGDYVIGLYDGGYKMLSKADYYAENYSAAKPT